MSHDRLLTALFAALVISILAMVIIFMPRVSFNAVAEGAVRGAQSVITIGGVPVSVNIASTEPQREQGLSCTAPLGKGQGMLFVFQQDGEWGFWMKDMNFPLDIIWTDAAGRVGSVRQSLSPATYPEVFYPSQPARYVLEVRAGFANLHHIATGTQMTLPN